MFKAAGATRDTSSDATSVIARGCASGGLLLRRGQWRGAPNLDARGGGYCLARVLPPLRELTASTTTATGRFPRDSRRGGNGVRTRRRPVRSSRPDYSAVAHPAAARRGGRSLPPPWAGWLASTWGM